MDSFRAFRGTFDHTLDAKNRLTVPARYRDEFAAGAVLAKPWDDKPYVGLWRTPQYDDFTIGAVENMSPLSVDRSRLERFMYGKSQEVELDRAGRIMIPGYLVEHASLVKDVMVVGVGNRLELWSPELWDADSKALDEVVMEVSTRAANPA